MKTLRISVDQISEYSYLEFGERGENAVMEVILDFSAWVEEFGEGIVNLYVKRGGDTSAYPVPLSVEGTVATWIVSETDTYKRGRGEAEYVYVVGEKIEKTAVFGFYVSRDIGQPASIPPSPYETWLETLMELSNTTLQNAQDAEESADKAEIASQHYPVIIDDYWWVWRVEEEAYVNSGVKAEGQGFVIKGTVATVADLPSVASQGDFWNVGTHEPYTMYMYQVGEGWINQGTLKGPTGTTFIPSVSEAGVISWTNDGNLPNPEPRNIRGPQGEQGAKGETGDSAGFGVPTATVDQTIGQASVSVSSSGPDTAKVFSFTFSGIKGERGAQGEQGARGEQGIQGERGEQGETGPTGTTFTPQVSSAGVISWTNDGGKSNPEAVNIKGPQGEQGVKGDDGEAAGFGTPTASATQTTGEASVEVTATGPDTAKVFEFRFSGIKGEQGIQGNKGDKGDKGDTGDPGKNFTIEDYVATPADLPSGVDIGTVYGVGTSEPYDVYIYSRSQGWVNNGTIQGPRGLPGDSGTTFTPAVSSAGVISWTNDGGLPNPNPVNVKGAKGDDGDAAGFGTPTASVDANVGTPSVTVTASGPSIAKVFDFQFKNLKGQKGDTGDKGDDGDPGVAAGFGNPTASVDANVGTPSVTISASGPDTAKVFNFQFKNLKGVQGEKGDDGDVGATFTPSVSSEGVISWTNDGGKQNPPSVNIKGPHGAKGDTGDKGDTGVTFTPSVSEAGVISWTNDGDLPNPSSVNIKGPQGIQGEQGAQGESGDDGVTFTPSVSNEGVISWTNDGGRQNPQSVNIKGPQGEQGNPGVAAGFGTPTASADQTVGTPSVSVTASGPNTAKVFSFQFSGIKGAPGDQGDKGDTGDTGTTFTPSVSSEGVISWTNDGGKQNPPSVSIRGPQGEQGIQGVQGETGEDGASAGFGTPSATVGTGTGTPSVSVSASGPDTAKVFSFAFDGLKGTPGTNGEGVPTGGTAGQFLKKSSGTDFHTEWATVEVPTKVSDLTNDAGYITGMEILSYGSSTFADFLAAYTAKKVVYCRASSNANPATGSQTRLAFMAYVNNADNPTEVEFQYYRSVSAHTASQQGDQVYVYKLAKTAGWTVTTREASVKVVAGTNMTSSYSNGVITFNADTPTKETVGLGNVDNVQQYSATNPPPYPVTSVNGSTGAVTVPTYESKAAVSGGTDVSLVTTGEKYIWNTRELPSGGSAGQVLKKSSATDYSVEWADESGASMFITFTQVGSSSSYTADKTFSEVYAAYQSGIPIFATITLYGGIYSLKGASSTHIILNYVEVNYVGNGTTEKIITFNSDESATTSTRVAVINQIPKLVKLHLSCNNNYEYQDNPSGTFAIEDAGVTMFDAYMLASMQFQESGGTDSHGMDRISLVYGSYDPVDNYNTFHAEHYELVDVYATPDAYDEEDELIPRECRLTFRVLSMRNSEPILKTVVITGPAYSQDDISISSTVTYSEVSLGQPPSATGVNF